MSYKIHQGNNIDTLKTFADNSIDSIITDPPYGIEFLGKDWDTNTGAVETWQECLRVLKPGGYLLAFSAARTYHQLATNIESVGFEIRDQLMWLYASGFPKAQDIGKAIDRRLTKQKTDIRAEYNGGKHGPKNVDLGMQGVRCPVCKRDSNARYDCKELDCGMIYKPQTSEAKQWSGWKTALKPAHEPIVMARKPFKGSTIDNVLKHGVGALNIDASRIPFVDAADEKSSQGFNPKYEGIVRDGGPLFQGQAAEDRKKDIPYSEYSFGAPGTGAKQDNLPPKFHPDEKGRYPANVLGEIPDYQKYFYCPKVSRKERHCGFEQEPITTEQMVAEMGGRIITNNRIWTPDLGEFYIHGLKHEYEEWCKKNKRDPLAHIETLSNYSQGDVKNHPLWDPSIGTNLQRLKHKIMEHNKDLGKNKDPLAHIPTSEGGILGTDGEWAPEHWHGEKGQKNKDPLAHIEKPFQTNNRLETLPGKTFGNDGAKLPNVGNNHPTVKPVALMRWLINLVTPKNSKVLDPFTGSGSTGMAAVELGHEFVGCELDPNYVAIAKKRIEGWIKTAGEPAEPDLPRMCGPGGSDWVKSQSHQGNNPGSDQANTFADIFEE